MERLHSLVLRYAQIRDTAPTHFAFADQVGNRVPSLGSFFVCFGGHVDLIEVNMICVEAAQTAFHFAAHAFCCEAFVELATCRVPHHSTFGRDGDLVASPGDCLADDLFRMSASVVGRRVYPVNAQIKRAVNRREGIVIVLRAPTTVPPAAPDSPCAQTNRRDVEITVAELARLNWVAPLTMLQVSPHVLCFALTVLSICASERDL